MIITLFTLAAFVGGFFLMKIFEDLAKAKKGLEQRLEWLAAETETLKQALCESKLFHSELRSFASKEFDSTHDYGSRIHSKDCVCGDLGNRTAILYDRGAWYGYRAKQNPAENEPEDDFHYDQSKAILHATIRKDLVPLFERLRATDPKALTSEHIQWLQRDEMDDLRFWQYLHWLIPELRDGLFGVKEKSGLAILDEIEKKIRQPGKSGSQGEGV